MKDTNTVDTAPMQYLPGLSIYPRSITQAGETTFFLARDESKPKKYLGISSPTLPQDFIDTRPVGENTWLCALSAGNAQVLRARLPWLEPTVLGLSTSFGFGDRLGLATPGHIRAAHAKGVAAIFAQQSVRENARTGRTP
jgi:hypothetical protein